MRTRTSPFTSSSRTTSLCCSNFTAVLGATFCSSLIRWIDSPASTGSETSPGSSANAASLNASGQSRSFRVNGRTTSPPAPRVRSSRLISAATFSNGSPSFNRDFAFTASRMSFSWMCRTFTFSPYITLKPSRRCSSVICSRTPCSASFRR